MANWAFVENGKVEGVYENLPSNWRNISGLNFSSDNLEFLNSVGWYKIKKNHESFDNELYEIKDYDYCFGNNSVTESLILVQKDTPLSDEYKHQLLLMQLREERNNRLKLTDWTQLRDVEFDNKTRLKWVSYRQKLRDLPKKYENVNFRIEEINWPEV